MRWGSSLGLSAALLAMLAAGIWLGGHPATLPPILRDAFVDSSGGLMAEATELVEDNYYRPVSQGELVDSSLRGMARGLRRSFDDRFSGYLSPEMLRRFNEEIEGHFSGVGLTVGSVARGLRTERVFRGSPAERAGIETGDVIVSVDGHSIAGVSSEAATARIKGPEGTAVELGVLRPPSREVRELRLTRAEISLPILSSDTRTVDGRRLAHLRLAAFTRGAHGVLRRGVRRARRGGAQGLVLDLRGNGGGLLDEAVLAASVFLSEGDVVTRTDSRSQGEVVYRAAGGSLPPLPIVVLIDGATASAAEILTAALADGIGSTVVGARSFGKGVFQQEIELSNGGALKLTVGEYFTPDGVNLAGNGIRPDVAARDRPRTKRDEALDRALEVLASRRTQE